MQNALIIKRNFTYYRKSITHHAYIFGMSIHSCIGYTVAEENIDWHIATLERFWLPEVL